MRAAPLARIALLAALALGVGCAGDKDVEKPSELVDFRESASIDRLWSASLGGGADVMRVGLAPAIEQGRVYAAGHDGDVAALQLADGKQLWRTRTKATLAGGPGVGSGLVVVGSADGEVIALDAKDGAQRWRVAVGGEVLSAPAVAEGAVVVRTVDGRLRGLSIEDGREIWREELSLPRLTLRGAAPPVVADGTAIAGFDNGRVVAVTAAAGEVLWESLVTPARGRTELERLVDIDAAVKVSGADVFVAGFQGRVAMLALDSGQTWWSRELSSHRGLDIDDDRVYVATAGGEVAALRRRTGIELWRQDALRRRGLSGPAALGPYVVVGDAEGYLHWMDVETGAFVARGKAGGRVTNSPRVADGILVVQDDDGGVSAFRPRAPKPAAPSKSE
jgi:outer membrane protein assembly factor BamB